jgi:hypothetical protein
MGLVVALHNEQGQSLQEVVDDHNLLHHLLPPLADTSYQCLRFVDWYGDTVFNQLQMDTFLSELARLAEAATHPEELALLAGIRALAEECQRGVHLFVKFIGD